MLECFFKRKTNFNVIFHFFFPLPFSQISRLLTAPIGNPSYHQVCNYLTHKHVNRSLKKLRVKQQNVRSFFNLPTSTFHWVMALLRAVYLPTVRHTTWMLHTKPGIDKGFMVNPHRAVETKKWVDLRDILGFQTAVLSNEPSSQLATVCLFNTT